MNALEAFRRSRGYTFEALAQVSNVPKPSVWRHCSEEVIPGEAAILYHARLGIPLEDLRPDLYPHPQPGPGPEHGEAA